ncbi:hypothetical protein WA158_008078 [Blastocystis sp. Blastoise]
MSRPDYPISDRSRFIPTGNQTQAPQTNEEKLKTAFAVEKVKNRFSSVAGANSSSFDIYRRAKYVELDRLESMKKEEEKDEKQREFEERIRKNKEECEAKTKKNADLRRRKKEKKRLAKQQKEQSEITDEKELMKAKIESIKMKPAVNIEEFVKSQQEEVQEQNKVPTKDTSKNIIIIDHDDI